jgi:hypothetical protein
MRVTQLYELDELQCVAERAELMEVCFRRFGSSSGGLNAISLYSLWDNIKVAHKNSVFLICISIFFA